jgi:transposase
MAKAVVKAKPKALTARRPGQPTLYRPEYCERIVEYMSRGFSYDAFSGYIDVHVDTLYEWEKVHPEFSEAKSKAFSKCRMFWESIGINHITHQKDGEQLNASVWIFNMKNRFKWTDRREDTVKTEVIDTKAKEDILLKARLVQELVTSEVRQLNEPTQASISDESTSCDEISRQLP